MSKYFKAYNTLKGPITHLKNIVSSAIGKKGKKSPTIKSVKPAVGKSELKKSVDNSKLEAMKNKGRMKRSFQKMEEDIDPARIKLRQTTQKIAGEPITKSGFSKGKDIKRIRKMGGGMMSRRFGMKAGSNKGKVPTTSKEKAFGMLSVKAKKDNNPNITFTDKIVGAKKK